MKKMKLYLIIFLVALGSSCKSYLDVKPTGKVLPKTADEFSSLLHAHLNDIDYGLENVIMGDAYSVLDYECFADNLDASLMGPGGSIPIYVGARVNDFQETYELLYEVIRTCNLVIDNMEERNSELGKKVLGTAYCLRGVCYYNLLRNFCEPYEPGKAEQMLGLSLVKTFDMEEKPLRSNLKLTKEFIADGLKTALSYEMNDPVFRFTADVAKAYLAKLHFWCQDWEEAASYAKEVLGKYPLVEGAAYTGMIQDQYGQKGNVLIRSYLFSGQGLADWDYKLAMGDSKRRPVSKEFIDLFPEKGKDIRYALSFNSKRQNQKNICARVRSAEMCLMLAECYAQQSDEKNALIYLNQLREKRISDYTPYTSANLPSVNPNALIKVDATGKTLTPLMTAIQQERQKELFMEGDRWFELKRNGRPEFWVAGDGLKYVISRYLYTAPLPKFDVELVPGLIQNEGYAGL